MDDASLFAAAHRRLNRLTGEWMLVSPHRTQRPWQGQVEDAIVEQRPAYDPDVLPLPRQHPRGGGVLTPDYTSTFVFDNDFAALLPDAAWPTARPRRIARGGQRAWHLPRRLLLAAPRPDPRRDADRADPPGGRHLGGQYLELGAMPWVRHVQIFENRGAMMGASNPHPHGQIWANEQLPTEAAKELRQQQAYSADGRCLLCDYLAMELQDGERVVCQNDHFVAVVPFWAVWPFETLVLPRAHRGALPDLDADERDALADILGRLTRRYDQLFGVPFPYSMGFHQRPTDGAAYPAMAPARALLPAAAAIGDRPQVHGRLRAARPTATRHHPRKRGAAATQPSGGVMR